MNVLSLFDGMSCGQQALERIGIKPDNYFASEIDKYAIKVTMANYPNTIQLGSVVDINVCELPKIDLLIGGSPCQSFSFAGKRKGMSTKNEIEILTLQHYMQLKSEQYEFEGQSYLFWEYMRILNELRVKNPNIYFLLENVEMGEKWEKVLTKAIGVNGIHINSSLVSAQNRKRIYWTNIGMKPMGLFGYMENMIEQPKDKGILLKDILENEVDEKYFLNEKSIAYINRNKRNLAFQMNEDDKKSNCIVARYQNGIPYNQIVVSNEQNAENSMAVEIVAMRGRKNENGVNEQILESNKTGKTNSLTSVQKDNLIIEHNKNSIEITSIMLGRSKNWGNPERDNGKHYTLNTSQPHGIKLDKKIRRLTPIECERLQTVKDNYTNHVSDTQRYKMLGNGWTIDVISHIFSYLKLKP